MQEGTLPTDVTVDLASLPPPLLADMAIAGQVYLACRKQLTASGRTIAEEIAGDSLEPFTHYPQGDVFDPESFSQYYFHFHRPRDFGHFHTFLRAGGIPSGLLPDHRFSSQSDDGRDVVCHLIAIALDHRGEPGELFTTNRWVTAETWYQARDVIRMLPRFKIEHDKPSALANRWLGAVVTLFRPQIEILLATRDHCIDFHRQTESDDSVLENRDLEITSSLSVDIDAHLAKIEYLAACR